MIAGKETKGQEMIRKLIGMGIIVTLAASVVCGQEIDWQSRRAGLGHQEKYRILVDKVLSKSNKWVLTDKHVDEIRDAGFNVLVPRVGGHSLGSVREHAEMARDRGMFYMSWVSTGKLTRNKLKKGQRGTKNMLVAKGITAPILSPNADEFWDILTDLVLGQARISAEVPSVIGAFFDFEGYAIEGRDHCYPLSYDDIILNRFAEAKGIELPTLDDAQRYPWLEKEGLHGEFREFQIDYWKQRCRKLRQQVDAINPAFQFIVYPIPGSLFTIEAFMPELATKEAPVIMAEHCTYGRWARLPLLHDDALKANQRILREKKAMMSFYAGMLGGMHYLYMSADDPAERGADPEFSAKNLVMISEMTNGYWIFYEGPTYDKADHASYFKWYSRANRAITSGRFEFWKEPREEHDSLGYPNMERRTNKPQVALYDMKLGMHWQVSEQDKYEVYEFQRPSLKYLEQFDVVVLQNFNKDLKSDDPIVTTLRKYVELGGGLFLTHDTAWFMASPFPEIANRGYPKNKVGHVRHVLDRKLIVAAKHEAVGDIAAGTEFTTEFTDHMIFSPGPKGTVLVENDFKDPVYVVGQCGRGRVAFSGSYYGYKNRLTGVEKDVFFSILDWLAGD